MLQFGQKRRVWIAMQFDLRQDGHMKTAASLPLGVSVLRALTYLCALIAPMYHATRYAQVNKGFDALYQDLWAHSFVYGIYQLLIYLFCFAGPYLVIAIAGARIKTTVGQFVCFFGIYAMPLYSYKVLTNGSISQEWAVVLLPIELFPWAIAVFVVALLLSKSLSNSLH